LFEKEWNGSKTVTLICQSGGRKTDSGFMFGKWRHETEIGVPEAARDVGCQQVFAPPRAADRNQTLTDRLNMNTMEIKINKIALQVEDIEPMVFESALRQFATTRPQPMPKSRPQAAVRYALLAVIVLLLGGLGFYVQSSINEINSDMQKIFATIVTEGSLGPD
jgi:hypothetical protein